MDQRIIEIRKVLDSLARAEHSDNDTKEQVYDRELAKIRLLDREGIIEIVKRAIGSDKRREAYSPFVFSELYDVQGIEAVFSELLKRADSTARSDIIQTIGLRKMYRLAGVLNEHFVHESDDFCRDRLLHTLAKLGDRSSLPIFEYLMRKSDQRDEWALVVAGKEYAAPEFLEYLTRVFENPTTGKSRKVLTAWGLAKQGESKAYDYLVDMLDDPVVRKPTISDPGASLRAAQAISDIHGWKFEWAETAVGLVKQRLVESSTSSRA